MAAGRRRPHEPRLAWRAHKTAERRIGQVPNSNAHAVPRLIGPTRSPRVPRCRLFQTTRLVSMAELVEAASFDAEWEQVEVRRPLDAVDLEPSL